MLRLKWALERRHADKLLHLSRLSRRLREGLIAQGQAAALSGTILSINAQV